MSDSRMVRFRCHEEAETHGEFGAFVLTPDHVWPAFPVQVAEEAMDGKMYVRGHDREGRPIIHYRPGLEKSFDTEKVSENFFRRASRSWSVAFSSTGRKRL